MRLSKGVTYTQLGFQIKKEQRKRGRNDIEKKGRVSEKKYIKVK